MSFADLASSPKRGSYVGAASDGDSEYIRLAGSVADNIAEILAGVDAIMEGAARLGTAADTPRLRDEIHVASEKTKQVARLTGRQIKMIGSLDGGTAADRRQRKAQQQKFMTDFQGALDLFKDAEAVVAERERDFVRTARSLSVRHDSPLGNASDHQSLLDGGLTPAQEDIKFQILENEIEFNDAIITEREEGIKDIEATIMEVNEIFRDLSTIVNEQGEALDRVEVNIDTTADQTGKAVDDLRDANAYDKAYRNKLCCCALCVAIAVAIVIFIVIIK